MNQGVEWALHGCVNLAWAGPDATVKVARMAELNGLPAAYLNKQFQALAREGLLVSTSGPKGGFSLGRAPSDISVLDVVLAIEGHERAFRCTEIRQQGPLPASKRDCRVPCAVASVMHDADAAWRQSLQSRTIADIAEQVARTNPEVPERVRHWLLAAA